MTEENPSTTVVIRSLRGPEELPRLLEVWRSAVDATHDFLAPADRDEIAAHLVPDYFPHVELRVAERDGTVVGFAGVHGTSLEMLFVSADARGTGVGSALLEHAVTQLGVVTVDVNEQNPQAAGFYEHRGFEVVGRSPLDGEGRPYPLLHLRLTGADATASQ